MPARKQVDDSDVKSLRQLLSGTEALVFGPSDEGYAQTIERWSRAAEKTAGVSVLPTSDEEVAIVSPTPTSSMFSFCLPAG